jgi:lysophospholipase L1-like esterase
MLKTVNNKANSIAPQICLACLIIIAICSDQVNASSSSDARTEAINIVALGDSTTDASWDGNAKEVYAVRLVRKLATHGVEALVVNSGIRNTTSREALERLDRDVRRHHPEFVIIQFGINDSWIDANLGRSEPRLTIDEYADCMSAIIDILRDDGAKVILMTPNTMRWSEKYGEEYRDPALGFDFDDPRGMNRLLDVYTDRLREVAAEKDVPMIDVGANFEAYDQVDGQSIHDLLIPGDEIHPSDAGHALIAGWLADLLLMDLRE